MDFFEEYFSPNFKEPANYEFVTIFGKSIKMEGILKEDLELTKDMKPVFWIQIPVLSDEWLQLFQQKYIKEVRRTPIAYKGNSYNLYRPQTIIYHPKYRISKISPDVLEIKIYEGELWKKK